MLVGRAGTLGVGPQQDVWSITESLRHRVHGDPGIEQCGRVRDPQIVKSQSGKTELPEFLSRCLGQCPCVSDSREIKPSTVYATGGKDQRLNRQPDGAQ